MLSQIQLINNIYMYIHVCIHIPQAVKECSDRTRLIVGLLGIVIATFVEHLLYAQNSLYMQHLILITIQRDRYSYSTFTDKKIEAQRG